MTVQILGSEWNVEICPRDADEKLSDMDGYTDWTRKLIVVCDVKPDRDSVGDMDAYKRKVLRHEIVHAFLFACGLGENACAVDAWATNEEMIDWFAFHGEAIHAAWMDACAI